MMKIKGDTILYKEKSINWLGLQSRMKTIAILKTLWKNKTSLDTMTI